jgi:DNA-binding XRE family transcriptional regulator
MTNGDLKAIREKLELTQTQMSVKANVALGTIAALEDGKLNPRPVTRRRLAEAYGVTIADIDAACSGKPAPSAA